MALETASLCGSEGLVILGPGSGVGQTRGSFSSGFLLCVGLERGEGCAWHVCLQQIRNLCSKMLQQTRRKAGNV